MLPLSSPIIADSVDFVCRREMTLVYKICRARDWQEAVAKGAYRGSADDHRDGFIHLSAAHQLRETAKRHFTGETDLVLLAFEAESLGPSLRWEPSRGGDLFPHLYGMLAPASVAWTAELPWCDGLHNFPPEIGL
jgi:uncharacterized protein (DUF952 family)